MLEYESVPCKMSQGHLFSFRCRILELASFIVEGADEDLINLIFDLVKYTLKVVNVI